MDFILGDTLAWNGVRNLMPMRSHVIPMGHTSSNGKSMCSWKIFTLNKIHGHTFKEYTPALLYDALSYHSDKLSPEYDWNTEFFTPSPKLSLLYVAILTVLECWKLLPQIFLSVRWWLISNLMIWCHLFCLYCIPLLFFKIPK